MNEDFTLKARWVRVLNLRQGIVAGPFKPKQANEKCAGVRLGRVGRRCVDRMLTATHKVEGVSATQARKEIRKNDASLG